MSEAKITLYKTSWCAFCHTEAQWMDKMGIAYVSKDIEADPAAHKELMEKSGGTFSGVPVTDIGGDLILGFDRPKLMSTMEKHGIKPKN